MSGNTVQVTLSSLNDSLQALACKNGDRVTVLFGGSARLDDVFDVNVVVKGLFESTVNYTVYETNDTGTSPVGEPGIKWSGTASVSGGQVTVPVTGSKVRSAYKISITSSVEPTVVPTSTPVGIKGDVNDNGTIDIVDALLIAQYYVGLNPQSFDKAVADVNCSGGLAIVDALLVA